MTGSVLDASALLALLLDEPGADIVEPLLTSTVMSTVNLAEVIGHFARNGVAEADIRTVLAPLPIRYESLDEDLAHAVGLLLPHTRATGLSFADRACLALAKRDSRTAVTADRQWSAPAAALGIEVQLIR